MATAQGMSGVDLSSVVAELTPLLPLWVGKIYQYDQKTLAIRLQGENHARHALVIESGRRAHLVKALPGSPERPGGFAMLLRKVPGRGEGPLHHPARPPEDLLRHRREEDGQLPARRGTL